jgi:hypothetical protein
LKKIFPYILIPLFGIVFYWNVLDLYYIADDWYYLQGFDLESILDSEKFLPLNSGVNTNHFRPIPMIFVHLFLNNHYQPWVPHLINLILHCLNGILVYKIFHFIRKDILIPLLGAILWLVCPIQVETVCWCSAIFSGFFYFFTMLMVLGLFSFNFWGSIGAMTGAMLSMEQAFILPLLMPLYWKPTGKYSFGIWNKGYIFWIVGIGILIIRQICLKDIGLYGWDFFIDCFHPLNWLKIIGYYLKCVSPL